MERIGLKIRVLALAVAVAWCTTAVAETRQEAAARAGSTFLNTFFFADGRGMHDYPGEFSLLEKLFGLVPWNAPDGAREKPVLTNLAFDKLHNDFGFNRDNGRVVGLYRTQFSDVPVGALACAFCHAGKVAGIVVPGLGNKQVSNSLIGKGATGFTGLVTAETFKLNAERFDPEAAAILEKNADRMKKITVDPSFVSPTEGLIEDNVVYKTFFQAFGLDYPSGIKGYVNKVPHLWGMSEKRRVGKFYDGAGDGTAPGWTVAVEIMNGQIEETIHKPAYLEKVRQIEAALDDFLPPKYPFGIDPAAQGRGATIFGNRCSRCHGTYQKDAEGLPIYAAPKLIALETVGTDPTRAEFFRDPSFWSAVAQSRYSDLLRMGPNFKIDERRYFAPRLDGVWARFPYLHNGSVPSLWAMLTPAERPEAFSLKDAGEAYRFDARNNGLTSPASALELAEIMDAGRRGAQDVYWTRRLGHSNQGHPFGSDLLPAQKLDLIEYLKSL
jgi:hypothetical protein